MPEIHPTAIIDPRATIADDVKIGPYCIVEGDVTLSAGTVLMSSVVFKGPTRVGANNRFYPFCVIGHDPQDRSFDPDSEGAGTVIGDDNIFRESVTISRATGESPTTVGDRNMFMANGHVAHDGVVGNDCNFANGCMVAGHAVVGDAVFFGGGAGVQQFTRIGRLSMIAGNEGITRDLPPFCMVQHTRTVNCLNLVGLRRAGYRKNIEPLKQAFDILFREGHSNQVAVELIREQLCDDELCMELADFVASTKRGITTRFGDS